MFSRAQQNGAGGAPIGVPSAHSGAVIPQAGDVRQVAAPQQRPAPSGPPPAASDIAETIRLRVPLPGHGGDIYEIHLRQPTFADWLECGEIHRTRVHNPGAEMTLAVDVDPLAAGNWFQRLSGLHMAQLARMRMDDSRDVFRAVVRLVGRMDQGNSETPPSSSGSSAA